MKYAYLAGVLLVAAATGCAPNTTPVTKKGYAGKPPLGNPLTFDPGVEIDLNADGTGDGWWWIPFDGSSAADEVAYCGDGSKTGLAVSPGAGADLLVFFDGGGACWNLTTCEVLRTAVDDNFSRSTFETELRDFIPSSITARAHLPAALDRPTIVFVPYCTGDVHGGDAVTDYGIGFSNRWWHKGHANVMAYLKRLGATFRNPGKLVVAGSSAGGFGALVNYEAFRWYWPDAQGYLIDDSGPALVNNDVPADLRDHWFNSWHLGVATDPFCLDCRTNLSAAFTELAEMHPDDRIAFVSHTQDKVMSPFMMSSGSLFETDLRQLEQDVLRPTGNVRAFYEDLDDHMMLTPLTPLGTTDYTASHVTGATGLDAWLQAMLDGQAWDSVLPPP
jgi:hypothetical protein